MLLNLDSEDRGQVYIGCAGGADVVVEAQLPTSAVGEDETLVRLALTGLTGGHSGLDIDKGRGNANRLLVRALRRLEDVDARLVDYQGVPCAMPCLVKPSLLWRCPPRKWRPRARAWQPGARVAR